MPQRAIEIFSQQLQLGKLHHGWIVENPLRLDIQDFIERILKTLISTDIEKIESHPNIFYLSSKQDLAVSDVRKAIDFSYQTSWNGCWKVVLIEEAERMNPQSQNALLKVFEEPPEKTFFLMISHRQNAFLPTLCSRAFMHFIQPMDYKGAQEQFLKKYPNLTEIELHLLQTFSNCSLPIVDKLVRGQFFEMYNTFLAVLADSMQDASQLYKVRQIIPEELKENEEDILFTTFHRFTLYLSSVDVKISSHEKESFDRMSQHFSLDGALEAWHKASAYVKSAKFYNLPTSDMVIKLCYLLFIEKTENLLSKEPV